MKSPLCSIIIPVYNRAALVGETIESCLSQDYPSIEIILVNDGSTDESGVICGEYAGRNYQPGRSVRLIEQANAGACVARNRGLEAAIGDFILFLDSDDLIPPTKLSQQIGAMERLGVDCCICDFQTIDAAGRKLARYSNNRKPHDFVSHMRSPSNSAIVLRRSSMPASLIWNSELPRLQDLDFMLRYLASVNSYTYLPEALYIYRLHDAERISDSYSSGLPYLLLYRSMRDYLQALPAERKVPKSLLLKYRLALLRDWGLNRLYRSTPRAVKDAGKKIISAVKTRNSA